ncbi:MAG: tetratricopeptide repeat protein [Pseudomonadota bacterium]
MASEFQHRFLFDEFEVQADRRELLNQGEPVEVEPRVFDLLVYLIEHRDTAVSKDELLEAIWPGAYVSDSSLTRCVMKARRAVGDDADRQQLIKTVHGHGYRFIGKLQNESNAQDRPAREDTRAAAKSYSSKTWLTALLLAVVAISTAAFLNRETALPSRSGVATAAVLPVQNNTGNSELDWITLGLMTAIRDQLASGASLQVIDSKDLLQGLHELARGSEDLPSADLAEAAAFQQFGVAYVISAALSEESDLYRLRATISALGEDSTTFDVFGDQPTRLAQELSQTILTTLVRSEDTAQSKPTISGDQFVNEAYIRGREQVLRGRVANAIDLLTVAVAQEPDNFQARKGLASAWVANGEAERAIDEYQALLDKAREDNMRVEEAKLQALIGWAHYRTSNYDDAETMYFAAVDMFEELGMPLAKAKALFNLARIAGERRQLDLERARLEAAARTFEEAGVIMQSGAALLALGNQALDQGEVDAGEQYFSDALRSFRTSGVRNDEAIALYSLSRVAELRGEFERAAALAESSKEIAGEFGRPWTEALGWRRMGMVDMAMGQLASAETAFKQAIRLARRIGADNTVASSTAQLAEVYRMLGRLDEAEQQLNEAQQLVELADIELGRRWLQIYQGRLALEQGAPEESVTLGRNVLLEQRDFIRLYRADALELLAKAYRSLEQYPDALSALRAGLEAAKQMGDQVLESQFAAEIGLHELAYGDAELAAGYLRLARDSAPTTYYPLILEAALASKAGDEIKAGERFLQARQIAADRWSGWDQHWVKLFSPSA